MFLLLLTGTLSAVNENPINGVGLQFRITPDILVSEDAFWAEVDKHTAEVLSENKRIRFVIFPEYIGVLYSLAKYQIYWKEASTFQEAFELISKEKQYSSMREFFIDTSVDVQTEWNHFAKLAKKYNVYILSGSYFHYDNEHHKLTNRGTVYTPGGDVLYEQDKVYLTPFEKDICNLDPGNIADAHSFLIDDKLVSFTICRDTFFEEWEDQFPNPDLWIDIKANGEIYGSEQRDLFERALPARVKSSGTPVGVTVCLTGYFLDFLWEGVSRVDVPFLAGPVQQASSSSGNDVINFIF